MAYQRVKTNPRKKSATKSGYDRWDSTCLVTPYKGDAKPKTTPKKGK